MMATQKSPQYITQDQLEYLVDQMNTHTDRIITTLGSEIQEATTTLSGRIEGLSSKVSRNGERLERLEHDMNILQLKLSGLPDDIETLKLRSEKADEHLEEIHRLLEEKA